MKRSTLIALVFAVVSYMGFALPAQAQRVTHTAPIHAWVVKERGFNDYKLAFVIPNSKQWKLVATTQTTARVLGTVLGQRDGVVDYDYGNGQRIIIVTAGGYARYGNGYFGTLNMWRNSVRVAWW